MFARIVSEIRYRVRALVRRRAVEREMDDELRFHLEHEVEKLVGSGVPRAEAERRARVAFGGVDRIREETRDARGIAPIESTLQDLRYALRGLRARKSFTAGVVLTLALGIGANATMFGIVDRVVFRAPPMLRDQATVHRVYMHRQGERDVRTDRNFAFPRYLDVLRNARSFTGVVAFQTRTMAVGDGENVREMLVTVASAGLFDLFDASPVHGRFFHDADDRVPEGAPVAVLGHAFWQTHFGGRNVIGETISIDRMRATIIGVAPKRFRGLSEEGIPAAYVPITAYAFAFRGAGYPERYGWSWLEMAVRRNPAVSETQAEAELTAVMRDSWRQAAAEDPGWGSVEDVRPRAELGPVQLARGPLAARESRVATWLAGVALVVLMIACANVANLLLSRAVSRRREVALRLALGVSRGRLMRQLLTESAVLALFGTIAGLLIAHWGAAGLRAWFLPEGIDAPVITDVRTLLFAAIATIAVALLTGLVPALHAGRSDVAAAIKGGSREGASHRSALRGTLLVVQAALSVVLLVGAGLFVRSLANVGDYRLGYDTGSLLIVEANMRGHRLDDAESDALNDRMLTATRSVPGVERATLAASVPFWSNEGRGLHVQGVDSVSRLGTFVLQAGSSDYFATTGTRILRGRAFEERDDVKGGPRVAVVSEGMARTLWPGQEALGRCFRIGADTAPCTTVIGIAEEVRMRTFADAREFAYYIPAAQYGGGLYPQLLVRVRGEPADHADALRRRLQAEMPASAYVTVTPLATMVDPNLMAWRFGATMFVVFGLLALVLAAIGLYSLVAYDVAQGRRDLSVRIALGASAGRLIRLVVLRGVRLVLLGVIVGSAVALWAAPALQDVLFQQSPRDPLIFTAIAAILLAVGVLATLGPARRATRVDPNLALRAD